MTAKMIWIVILVVQYIEGQSTMNEYPPVNMLIQDLSDNLSNAFKSLREFMDASNVSKNIRSSAEPVTDLVAKEILAASKKDTENLVKNTSAVVDKIQERITSDFVEYSNTPSIQYNIECQQQNYMFYFRSKAIKNSNVELTNCSSQSMPFSNDSLLNNIKTNRQHSTVHVPTNVYDSSKEIQDVANYTQNLDQTFALSESMPQIKWQFFCSNTGFFKIFPGIKWHIQIEDMVNDNTKVDFFDCRSEQWFLESTAYPKKMMIMVDRSGSMKGRRKIIANHTIYEILNTMTENDYFNIILFTKDHWFVDPNTTEILMQATEKNKKLIMDQLDIFFVPDGIAEYDYGLKVSFKMLQNEWSKQNSTTVYNYLLMIITDGSPFNYQEVIAKENQNINARIFTYLIGQASSERDIVKQMACNNRGYAVEIATLADVKENVQKYLNVVARRNSIMQDSFYVWTGVHQYQMRPSPDISIPTSISVVSTAQLGISTTPSFVTNISQADSSPGVTMGFQGNVSSVPPPVKPKIEIIKPEPIKMFVTVSKAAYDVTNATIQKKLGKLLGAVGVDVPISDFLKTVPFWKIGVNAYFFGITHNGFVIFHPRFRPQDKKFVKYFYRNVDISELEVTVDQNITQINQNQTVISSLRDAIFEMTSDNQPVVVKSRATFDIIDEYKTAFSTERDYYITEIDGTSYKFGIAIPTDQVVPKYKPLPIFVDMDLSHFSDEFKNSSRSCNVTTTILENQGGFTLKNHEFCNLNKQIAELLLQNPLCALREVILNKDLRDVCLLKHGTNSEDQVLKDYIQSLYMEAKETSNLPRSWAIKGGNASRLSIQQIFSMHHFGLIRYYNYKNLSYENFISDHNAAIQDPLYQETILTSKKYKDPKVLVVRPLPNDVVKKFSDEKLLVFTVTTPIVAEDNADLYKGIVGIQVDHKFYSDELMKSSCRDGKCISCSNSSMFDCYVVTGSGMVVLNNLNIGNTGEMLKEIDCKLMESMVNAGVFESQSLYDFQDLCSIIPKVESFANILIDPFTKMFRLSIWIIYELFILVQNISITSLLWMFTYQEEKMVELSGTSLDNDDMKITTLTTESVLIKPLVNLESNVRQNEEVSSPGPKSKRQHEFFVKNTLEEKINYCKRNNQSAENDLSGCIQKAVTDICKLDKTHNGKQSDQHVEKLTSLNTISHCVTVCLMLQSDYPTIWQEQDDCRQPNNMCRTVTTAFTSKLTFEIKYEKIERIPERTPERTPERYTEYQSNENSILNGDDANSYQSAPLQRKVVVKNGSMCGELCPAKTWYATALEGTNLILIVVHKQNAACTCDCTNKFGLKDEIKRNTSISLENPRVQPPNYYLQFDEFNKEENSTECSDDSGHSIMPFPSMVIISTSLLFLMMW